jgi:hypothetical protein
MTIDNHKFLEHSILLNLVQDKIEAFSRGKINVLHEKQPKRTTSLKIREETLWGIKNVWGTLQKGSKAIIVKEKTL